MLKFINPDVTVTEIMPLGMELGNGTFVNPNVPS